MNYLLDTHTFLWAIFDDDKLAGELHVSLQAVIKTYLRQAFPES